MFDELKSRMNKFWNDDRTLAQTRNSSSCSRTSLMTRSSTSRERITPI